MRLARTHLGILEIPAKDKDYRPIISYLKVEREGESNVGRMIACDGFILAVVPVTLDAADIVGLVSIACIKQAAKDSPRRDDVTLMLNQEDSATTLGGVTLPRVAAEHRDALDMAAYPDFHRVLPQNVPTLLPNAVAYPIVFNVNLLAKLGKALASETGMTTLWPHPTSLSAPMLVTASPAAFEGLPEAPFGVLMPMYSPDNAWAFQTVDQAIEARAEIRATDAAIRAA